MSDYEYFKDNLSTLFEKYGNRFLVIKDKSVIGVFEDFKTAYYETLKNEKLGTFIIQECVDDPAKLVQHFQFNLTFRESASA